MEENRLNTLLSIGDCAALACVLEVSVPKPGNVHRGADFEDVTFTDFMTSAVMIARPLEATAQGRGVGKSVLAAIQATQMCVHTNTNLGTVLLFGPLAAVPREISLTEGIQKVLDALNADDAAAVYEAIRLAKPGAMDEVPEYDLHQSPPNDLIAAMRAASDRDMVARQYSNGFQDVLQVVLPSIEEGLRSKLSFIHAVLRTHLHLMSQYPDSLITRKCGSPVAGDAALLAQAVLDAGEPGDADFLQALSDFDSWLRSDGHQRNPGTTADLIAAGIFAGLREGVILPNGMLAKE